MRTSVVVIMVLILVNAILWLIEPAAKTIRNAITYSFMVVAITYFAMQFLRRAGEKVE